MAPAAAAAATKIKFVLFRIRICFVSNSLSTPKRNYVMGGSKDSFNLLGTVERYDPIAGSWFAEVTTFQKSPYDLVPVADVFGRFLDIF